MSTLLDRTHRPAHTGDVSTRTRSSTSGTTLDYNAVPDANLADTVAAFATDLADSLADTLADVRIRSAQMVETVLIRTIRLRLGHIDTVDLGWVTVPSSAVDVGTGAAEPALREAAEALGLTLTEACEASGIAWRTFMSWTSATRPRVASQGRLWELVHLAQDLQALLDGQAYRWVAANPEVRQLIVSGQFKAAISVLLNDRARRGTYRDAGRRDPRSAVGVGVEPDDDHAPAADAVQAASRSTRRRSAARTRGKGDRST